MRELCDTQFLVGEESEEFFGYRGFLAAISPVFRSQLYGTFKEGRRGEIVHFPAIKPCAFRCIAFHGSLSQQINWIGRIIHITGGRYVPDITTHQNLVKRIYNQDQCAKCMDNIHKRNAIESSQVIFLSHCKQSL